MMSYDSPFSKIQTVFKQDSCGISFSEESLGYGQCSAPMAEALPLRNFQKWNYAVKNFKTKRVLLVKKSRPKHQKKIMLLGQ